MSGQGDPMFDMETPGTGALDDPDYIPGLQQDYEPTYLYSSGGDHQADRNRSKIARAEWNDYKKRFRPIENELIGQIGDRSTYADAVTRSTESVSDTYQTGLGELDRNMARYGVTQSDIERADNARRYGLSRATSMAEAANRARSAVKNRNMQIMGGGLAPSTVRKQQQE